MKKKILSLITIVFILLISCEEEIKTVEIKKYQVINPHLTDTIYNKEYVTEIMSSQYVEIRTRVKGFIEKVYVDEGKFVKKDQLLFSISRKEYELELQKAIAMYKNALAEYKTGEFELENAKTLYEKDIISNSEYKLSQIKLESLKAKLDEALVNKQQAETNLSYTDIKAPFDGIINRIPHKKGSLIEEGTMLTSISNNDIMYAYFNVSEEEYLSYIKKQSSNGNEIVELRLVNNSLYSYLGKIETIESEFDPISGNIAFRATFPNPEGILRNGSNGKIIVKNDLDGIYLIPQKSTFEIQDQVFVYKLKSDNSIEQFRIIPKLSIPNFYVIENGITEKDIIIFEGVQNLRAGDFIEPQKINFKEVLNKTNLN